jgi:hypothetical protein
MTRLGRHIPALPVGAPSGEAKTPLTTRGGVAFGETSAPNAGRRFLCFKAIYFVIYNDPSIAGMSRMIDDPAQAASVSLTGWEIEQGEENAPICLTLSFEDLRGAEGRLSLVLPPEAAGPLGRTLMQIGAQTVI